MSFHRHPNAASTITLLTGVLAATLAIAAAAPHASAQTTPAAPTARRVAMCELPGSCAVQTFYLANSSQPNDSNEITTALRNLLPPETKIYLVPSQNAIVMQASPEMLALAQRLINELDRPKKTYRLNYTITEMDAGKRIGTQHFSMVLAAGERGTLKEGSKVPVATGSYSAGVTTTASLGVQTQFTYLDVGMNFDATLSEIANGAKLKAKIEQSSIAEEKSGVGAQDPVVRQAVLEGSYFLKLGKPLVLGSIDVLGNSRHLDLEVTLELLP